MTSMKRTLGDSGRITRLLTRILAVKGDSAYDLALLGELERHGYESGPLTLVVSYAAMRTALTNMDFQTYADARRLFLAEIRACRRGLRILMATERDWSGLAAYIGEEWLYVKAALRLYAAAWVTAGQSVDLCERAACSLLESLYGSAVPPTHF